MNIQLIRFANSMPLNPSKIDLSRFSGPELTSHTSTTLIFKYEDWAMSHEIVDAEAFYPGVDLSGDAEQFIRAFFIEDIRPSLYPELRDMAVKQREAFDIPDHTVYRDSLGSFDILGGYSERRFAHLKS